MLKILSYNVNGIRAAMGKGFVEWLKSENPDIIGIQETKAQPDQIETSEFEALGYKCYWFSAQKKGYSGVGVLTKLEPKHVEYGMGIEKYDFEGRFIRADFDNFSFVSVYHPSGTTGDARQAFKMQWLTDFQTYANELRNKIPNLIISGDFNICRLWIDIHNPKQNQTTSGFLPEERDWFAAFTADGYCDSFRKIYPELKHQYSWWSYRAGARGNNKGWRIDYHIVTEQLSDKISDAFILQDVVHADHCPVGILLNI
jgi:exodeoxyribonuclease-3